MIAGKEDAHAAEKERLMWKEGGNAGRTVIQTSSKKIEEGGGTRAGGNKEPFLLTTYNVIAGVGVGGTKEERDPRGGETALEHARGTAWTLNSKKRTSVSDGGIPRRWERWFDLKSPKQKDS